MRVSALRAQQTAHAREQLEQEIKMRTPIASRGTSINARVDSIMREDEDITYLAALQRATNLEDEPVGARTDSIMREDPGVTYLGALQIASAIEALKQRSLRGGR